MGRSVGKRRLSVSVQQCRDVLRPCWSLLERLLVAMSAHVRLYERLLWGMDRHAHFRSR
jgi:hypothetical protein